MGKVCTLVLFIIACREHLQKTIIILAAEVPSNIYMEHKHLAELNNFKMIHDRCNSATKGGWDMEEGSATQL